MKKISLKNILKKTFKKKTKPKVKKKSNKKNKKTKIMIVESLWEIIYSDKSLDMYESSLMRRLSGLLYLDNKIVGDNKEKIKKKFST